MRHYLDAPSRSTCGLAFDYAFTHASSTSNAQSHANNTVLCYTQVFHSESSSTFRKKIELPLWIFGTILLFKFGHWIRGTLESSFEKRRTWAHHFGHRQYKFQYEQHTKRYTTSAELTASCAKKRLLKDTDEFDTFNSFPLKNKLKLEKKAYKKL